MFPTQRRPFNLLFLKDWTRSPSSSLKENLHTLWPRLVISEIVAVRILLERHARRLSSNNKSMQSMHAIHHHSSWLSSSPTCHLHFPLEASCSRLVHSQHDFPLRNELCARYHLHMHQIHSIAGLVRQNS